MANSNEMSVVVCVPGFPVSAEDPDKPFLLNHVISIANSGVLVTVVAPACAGSPAKQIIEGVRVVRVRYAPRKWETLAATGAMYREARGIKALLVPLMLLAMVYRTIREIRSTNAGVVHGHWWLPGGLVAVCSSFLTRRTSVVHLHGSDATLGDHPMFRWFARRVLRSADLRIAVSENLADWGRVVSDMEFEVLPMPLMLDRFACETEAPENGPILAVGRLVDEKGFDVLIEAAALAFTVDESSRRKIVILGEGPQREAIAQKAAKCGLELEMPGVVSPEHMRDWYEQACFVVVPSRREGFGMVAAEALASSRAVIGSSVGGIPLMLEDNKNGILVKPGDIEDLKRALLAIDPRMGVLGPDSVKIFAVDNHVQLLLKHYKSLTNFGTNGKTE